MNISALNFLLVPLYLILGTFGIALLMGWVLKRFGSPGKDLNKPRTSNQSRRHKLKSLIIL